MKLIKDQCFKKLHLVIANEVMKDLVGSISNDAIVNASDEEGISTKGYKALYCLLGD